MADQETSQTDSTKNIWRTLATKHETRWSSKGKSDRDAQTRLSRGFVIPEVEPSFLIPLDQPIFTIGSCFARNIEDALANDGAQLPTKSIMMDFAAERGLRPNSILNKYNIPSIVQELSWALNKDDGFKGDYLIPGGESFVDPHLDDQTPDAPIEDLLERHAQVTEVFAQINSAKTIVITLGMTEAWHDTRYGITLNTAPSMGAINADPGRFVFRAMSYEENKAHMETCADLIFSHAKPDARMILTVSPVALNFTFSGRDVIVANSQSKATLVTLAQATAAEHPHIDYFPSYEAVTGSDPLYAWEADRRHTSPRIVEVIVAEFLHRYAGQPKPDWPEFKDNRLSQIIHDLHRNTKRLERMVIWAQAQKKK